MSPTSTVQLLVLERREPALDMARFYVLSIEETLFGDTALVREWGRIGTTGRRRLDLFEGHAEASEALELWLGRKMQRGYRPQLALSRMGVSSKATTLHSGSTNRPCRIMTTRPRELSTSARGSRPG